MRSWLPIFVFFVVIALAGALLKVTLDFIKHPPRTQTGIETATEPVVAKATEPPPEEAAEPPPISDRPLHQRAPAPAEGNPFVRTLAGGSPHWSRPEDAADHVAGEILDALADQPLLVVWLFDGTESNGEKRSSVIRRLESIYQTYDDLQKRRHPAFSHTGASPLLTVIASYAGDVQFHTAEPTADRRQIVDALDAIRGDTGGVEQTFTSIRRAVDKFLKPAIAEHRRLILVVVSDEMGDDAQQVDELVPVLRKHALPLYVIGVPAPFGRSGSVSRVPVLENFKPVHQGPESLESEVLDLGSWSGPQPPLDSGFGPFALSRLAIESGGCYMPVRSMTLFDGAVMARYAPNYVSRRAYQALLDENKARSGLVETARRPHLDAAAHLTLEFRKTDEASLKRLLDKAQQAAARLEPELRGFYPPLAAGESDRERLEGKRWQVGYDLAMGQVAAARSRIEGYNAALAQLKQGKNFPKPGQSTWVLRPTNDVRGDSSLERLAAQARKYLERVTHDHPSTPWAMVAARELASPMGWEWTAK